jgi:hypothetical protein
MIGDLTARVATPGQRGAGMDEARQRGERPGQQYQHDKIGHGGVPLPAAANNEAPHIKAKLFRCAIQNQ